MWELNVKRTIDALISNMDEKSIRCVIYGLGDLNCEVQEYVYDSLSRLGNKILPYLVTETGNPDANIRYYVSQLIGDILNNDNDLRALAPLLHLLEDEDYLVNRAAYHGLKDYLKSIKDLRDIGLQNNPVLNEMYEDIIEIRNDQKARDKLQTKTYRDIKTTYIESETFYESLDGFI